MPLEQGGRADKSGNRYEIRMVIYQLLRVLEEKIEYVVLEALGDDEKGVDIWIGHKNGKREGQQCKGRNGSKEFWDFGTANAKSIFSNWKHQLDNSESTIVALVSPLPFTMLEDLIGRAKNTSENPSEFYSNQIGESGKEFRVFFENFCKVMDIDSENENDLVRCIDYLKRIENRQFPDSQLKEIILDKIIYVFQGNEQHVYDTFVAWIVDGDILGKQICQKSIYDFLREHKIRVKDLSRDERVVPRLEELNKEYHDVFIPLNNGMFDRDEFLLCREAIESGESLIIHGKAGVGKSGCTEDIIKYCHDNHIQYVAIKLDKRIPTGNAEKWGKELGLPTSIVHCIHSVTKHEKAVIILDQLDALRWTQAHSRDALLVCSQIIRQVERLNCERKLPITIVFVCRTYDLENDNNIKSIFNVIDKSTNTIKWNKVQVGELKEGKVREIVGKKYENLTGKMRGLLRCPSNLYIWQQLDPQLDYLECSTTNHLVTKWWGQLEEKCFDLGLSESGLNETKDILVEQLDKLGRICAPISILSAMKSYLEFLSSNGFLVIQENKVSFAHQSILDSFIAENMLKQYFNRIDLKQIIGTKEKQTPGRRYQIQMLMQSLIEYDSQDFLNAGLEMLNGDSIRYSNKFVFFEVLNQVEQIDTNIKNFIVNNCEDARWGKQIIDNVIYSKPQYCRLLRDTGILDKWFNIPEKKERVFNLLVSIRPHYDSKDVEFIERYAFKSEEDDNKFAQCFLHDINSDSEEMFELRMKFYHQYPQMTDTYLNVKKMIKDCELRTIRYFAFLLEYKIKCNGNRSYRNVEEYLHEDSELFINNGLEVVELLLPFLPKENDGVDSFSEWSGRYHKRSFERLCVEILKKANTSIILSNTEVFWNYYSGFMGKGYYLYNELLLDAFNRLPKKYSDRIVSYLYSDLENRIFDKTSGNGDELLLTKIALEKHSQYCDQSTFNLLENRIIHYISPRAKEIFQRRINYNNENNGYTAYWSFWGDLQYEILKVLPSEKMSSKGKEMLRILERKFIKDTTLYKYSDGHGGWVRSPIFEKSLNDKNWVEILTNSKIRYKKSSNWKAVPGGFIESSVETFSRSFSDEVSKNPVRMMKLVLSPDNIILEQYIDSLFSGVAHSNHLNDIPVELLEKIVLKFSYDHTFSRASYICRIIERRENVKWSNEILSLLKDIAVNHRNPENEKPNVTCSDDEEMRSVSMLISNSLNCVRGDSASAIGHLLWSDSNLFKYFEETIEHLVMDKNSAVKFASLNLLWPIYNIDKKWAEDRILMLFEQDYRLAGFYDTKTMFFLLYPEHRERVIEIIKNCYKSEDKDLIRIGAHCVSEMFILYNEFVSEMNDVESMSKVQAEEILNMVILYYDKDEYNSLAKEIICKFKSSNLDLEMPISRLFYDNLIDLERDKEFLVSIMNSELSRRTLQEFVHYLEEESKSIIDFKDIIIALCYNLINNDIGVEERVWGIDEAISKLVIGLYDEASGTTQQELQHIANECLDLWDMMFEKQIGSTRRLSQEMMER